MPVQERWGLELRQEGEEDIDPHIYGDKLLSFHYKWQEPQRNIASGDVVLIKYATKSKSGEYNFAGALRMTAKELYNPRECPT